MARLPAIDAKTYLPTFIKLIQDIALALPASTITRLPDVENNWVAGIKTPQIDLDFRLNSLEGKLETRINWPTWKSPQCAKTVVSYQDILGTLSQDERNAVVLIIKSSLDKGATKIARDIQTRLIPYAELAYRRAVERCHHKEQEQRIRQETIMDLCRYFGVIPPREKFNTDDGVGVQVNTATSVNLDITCTPEMAKKIIYLLRSEKN
jgi:hypothetical protein